MSSVCTVSFFFFCFPFICPNSANNDPSQRKMEEGACVFARRPFEEPLQREVPLGPAIEKQVSQAECFHADSSLQHLQFTCDIFPYNLRDGWDTSAMCGWQLVGEALGPPPPLSQHTSFPFWYSPVCLVFYSGLLSMLTCGCTHKVCALIYL